jgi:murein L,D-transpeptidase YafK
MKGILEYNLDERYDEMAMKRAMKSSDMASFIWELKHNFWRKWKHDDSDFNLETYKEALNDLLDEYNIIPDELTD